MLAQNGRKQLRIAETEKYAHVTFFFNGGVEEPDEGEKRVLMRRRKPEIRMGEQRIPLLPGQKSFCRGPY